MKNLKQEIYFPIIIGIHFIFWAIDLYFYKGSFMEVHSDTMFFGEMKETSWNNNHRILGEVFSSWVVTVFAFNFLMATRAKWVERIFGGLDKMYLIHRRSGVIAVVLLLAHFFIVPRDLVAFNPGKPLGFYAFALILVGVILSAAPIFKRKIPYHKWINIHKLMGVFYVMAVMHGLMVNSLIKELPITRIYVFGMSFLGIGAWAYRAFFYNLVNKKLTYTISSIKDLGNQITEIILAPENTSLQFSAGQFAFFTFPSISKKEQHPFTISSHPNKKNLRITVKGLGDYTDNLAQKLEVGQTAKVEGAFGHFTLDHTQKERQIWVAGGIGITPFLSLAKQIKDQKVDLFWCVNKAEEAVYSAELEKVSRNNPNLNVHIWASSTQGYIKVDNLNVDDFSKTAFFICGPAALKQSLFKSLKSKGVSMADIHDEEFAFR